MIRDWKKVFASFTSTLHSITNHQVTVNGDEAHCRSYVVALHNTAGIQDGEDQYTTWGVYDHHFKRVNDHWKIAGMKYRQLYSFGNEKLFGSSAQ